MNVRIGVFWLYVDRFLKTVLRLGQVAVGEIQDPQVIQTLGALGIEPQRLLVVVGRLLIPARLLQDVPQVVVRLGVLLRRSGNGERLVEAVLRLLVFLLPDKG